jgi:hypothetical protein
LANNIRKLVLANNIRKLVLANNIRKIVCMGSFAEQGLLIDVLQQSSGSIRP